MAFCHSFCIFVFILQYITYIHKSFTRNICWGPSSYLNSFTLSGRNLPWGAEPRFELGPAGSDLCIPKNETARPHYFQNIIIMFCRPISTFIRQLTEYRKPDTYLRLIFFYLFAVGVSKLVSLSTFVLLACVICLSLYKSVFLNSPCEQKGCAGFFKQSVGEQGCRTGPQGWRNWFIGIDSGVPKSLNIQALN